VAKKSNIAIIDTDLVIEPAVDDRAILRSQRRGKEFSVWKWGHLRN